MSSLAADGCQRSRRKAAPVAVSCAMIALAAAALGGCGAPTTRGEQLREAVLGYNESVRWGRHERAAQWLPAQEREAFLAEKRRASASLHIHEIEIRQVDQAPDGRNARVRVALTYSRVDDPRLQTLWIEQLWQWTTTGGWMLLRRQAAPTGPAQPSADPTTLY